MQALSLSKLPEPEAASVVDPQAVFGGRVPRRRNGRREPKARYTTKTTLSVLIFRVSIYISLVVVLVRSLGELASLSKRRRGSDGCHGKLDVLPVMKAATRLFTVKTSSATKSSSAATNSCYSLRFLSDFFFLLIAVLGCSGRDQTKKTSERTNQNSETLSELLPDK